MDEFETRRLFQIGLLFAMHHEDDRDYLGDIAREYIQIMPQHMIREFEAEAKARGDADEQC